MRGEEGRWLFPGAPQPHGERHGLGPAQVLAITFALLIAAGTALLVLPAASATGRSIGLLDAFFTATSAVCVTGLVVLDTGSDFSFFGQLVIMALIQAGGLGTVILYTLAILVAGRRISLRQRVMVQEALGQFAPGGIIRLVRQIAAATIAIEAFGALLLFIRFVALYPIGEAAWLAIFHAVSAFNNAGFDLFGTSLRGFAQDPLVIPTVMVLVILGGLGFTVLSEVSRAPRRLSLHARLVLRTSVVLLLTGWVLFLGLEWNNPRTLGGLEPGGRLLAGFFLSVTPRTAGFEVVPVAALTQASLLVAIMFMFIGASPGGTGGGVKTTTLATLVVSWAAAVRGRPDTVIEGRRLPHDLVQRAWVLGSLSTLWVLVVTALLLVTEGKPIGPVLFEAVSAFGTVGLSTGLTPDLTPVGKVAIILMMYTGRVGPLTLAVSLAQQQAAANIGYPEERVMIG